MTLLRKCLLELRARREDCQMSELNGYDIEGVSGDNNAVHTNEEFAATTARRHARGRWQLADGEAEAAHADHRDAPLSAFQRS
jgi:hypothetical protein